MSTPKQEVKQDEVSDGRCSPDDVILVKTEAPPRLMTPSSTRMPSPPAIVATKPAALPVPIQPRPVQPTMRPCAPSIVRVPPILPTRFPTNQFLPRVPLAAHAKRMPLLSRHELDSYKIGHDVTSAVAFARGATISNPVPVRDTSVVGMKLPPFVLDVGDRQPRRSSSAQPEPAHNAAAPPRDPDFLQRRTSASAGALQIPALPQNPFAASSSSAAVHQQQDADAPLDLCVRPRHRDVSGDEPLNLCVRRDVTTPQTAPVRSTSVHASIRYPMRAPAPLNIAPTGALAQPALALPRPAHAHAMNALTSPVVRQLRPAHCGGSWPKPEPVLPPVPTLATPQSNRLARAPPPNVTVRPPPAPLVGVTSSLLTSPLISPSLANMVSLTGQPLLSPAILSSLVRLTLIYFTLRFRFYNNQFFYLKRKLSIIR